MSRNSPGSQVKSEHTYRETHRYTYTQTDTAVNTAGVQISKWQKYASSGENAFM